MAGKKKPKGLDYADKLSKKKAYKARLKDLKPFGMEYDPIRAIDDLIANTFPGKYKKNKKLGGAIMRSRGGTFKGTF